MNLRTTQRLFLNQPLSSGQSVTTSEEQAHYLRHVLRLQNDDVVRLFNGREGEFRATLHLAGKREVSLHIHEQIRAQKAEPDLWLCCAPIKKNHFDTMLEKATELGVSEIQPILTHRTQIREVNGDRAYAICREAAEQSERLGVPAVGNPVSLDDFIDVFPKDRTLIVCAELGHAEPVHQAFLRIEHTAKAAIITGPEGGFAPEELEKLSRLPFSVAVRLGPRILRADTAAIAALVCWQAFHGDWKDSA